MCVFRVGGGQGLRSNKQLIGNYDDILDMVVLPRLDGTANDDCEEGVRLAVITNSNQVRVVDENFCSRPLDGHTDIVLAVDCSPDGYDR
jgi:hypothetical protein